MSTALRFKVDHNLPVEVARALRDAGHDADTAADEGLAAASDPDVAEACRRERRALVTADAGFADIRAYPPGASRGIVVLRLRRQSKRSVVAAVARVLPLLEAERLDGRLWIVDESAVRIRGA